MKLLLAVSPLLQTVDVPHSEFIYLFVLIRITFSSAVLWEVAVFELKPTGINVVWNVLSFFLCFAFPKHLTKVEGSNPKPVIIQTYKVQK